ncbi:MAG: hypothetical protein HY725_17445 [Candidatus Rokubacteria bacterium]|nr:hypothetical protein [Candidatus Rokubacteria bacterium]
MRHGDEIQRTHGVPVQIRVGLNYTAMGQTTHLAARMGLSSDEDRAGLGHLLQLRKRRAH